MTQIVTPSQMRLIEKISDENGISYSKLMDNAGSELASFIINTVSSANLEKKILFLCGKGNNAGDCFNASDILVKNGFEVYIALLCGEPESPLALKNFSIIREKVNILRDNDEITAAITRFCVIVDGVFGTGFHGELSKNIQEIFKLSQNAELKIAVDVPSGGNSLTGQISLGTFKADFTLTFAFVKSGMTQYPLHSLCGRILTANIGITDKIIKKAEILPVYMTDNELFADIPSRKPDSHKGCFGKLINVCGSTRMSGAAMMAGKAALRSGAGILVTASPEKSADRMAIYLPEGMTIALKSDVQGFMLYEENYDILIEQSKSASAMLIGCGIGVTENTCKLTKMLVKNAECPLIIDADGINCIADCIEIIKEAKYMPILTPHPAEMARMMHCTTSEIQSDRLNAALSFASRFNAVVSLKGAGTIIASPQKAYINNTGNPGMSTGGSGDVLAGITASFRCQGFEALWSAAAAVLIHGMAGDAAKSKFSEYAMLPTDIIEFLGEAFRITGL